MVIKDKIKGKKSRAKHELSSFKKEFRKHLTTFITGAFAFVAALLWRDAIKSLLDRTMQWMPEGDEVFYQFFTAILVSIVAVVAIVIISRILKVEEK